jgi:hypothetical protein
LGGRAGVSFLPQRHDDDCGAAALAMMLTYHRSPTTQAEILAEAPAREGGVTAGELRDIARRRGFVSFVLVGDWSDLEGQIQHNRPVLVGLVKPLWDGRARTSRWSSASTARSARCSRSIRRAVYARTRSKGSHANGRPLVG